MYHSYSGKVKRRIREGPHKESPEFLVSTGKPHRGSVAIVSDYSCINCLVSWCYFQQPGVSNNANGVVNTHSNVTYQGPNSANAQRFTTVVVQYLNQTEMWNISLWFSFLHCDTLPWISVMMRLKRSVITLWSRTCIPSILIAVPKRIIFGYQQSLCITYINMHQ